MRSLRADTATATNLVVVHECGPPSEFGGGPHCCIQQWCCRTVVFVQSRDDGAAGDLYDAAWGSTPGRWPLPAATDCESRWLRAVALGGQGRYSAADAELCLLEQGNGEQGSRARSNRPTGELRALAASTRASFLRQMGGHDAAARWDGVAIALVGLGPPTRSLQSVQARCDALTGLAADALGTWRFSVSGAMLSRCRVQLAQYDSAQMWRQHLRLQWVSAELAMMSGDGERALRHALDARERATDTVSLRHRAKTDLIVAASYSSIGDNVRASNEAHMVLEACAEQGLSPLRWAAAMMLNGLGESAVAGAIIVECADMMFRRGGVVAGA